jgi:hypothetical protein
MIIGASIQITSTFVCTPLEVPLRRAIADAGIADGVGLTPPAQMSEYMLAPNLDSESILGTIVLVRVEDWLREFVKSVPEPAGDSRTRQELRTRLDEFHSHLTVLSLRGSPVWFLICPSIGWISEQYKLGALCRTFANLLAARVSNLSQVTMLTWPSSWSSPRLEDNQADREMNVPFRQEALDQLAEFLVPQIVRTLASENVTQSVPASAGSPELTAFLAGLRVAVEVAPARSHDRPHIDRVLRTAATFSLTGELPTIAEAQIDAILASEHCWVVSVNDRLCDHGLSGVVVARSSDAALVVDRMSLSCPVLGKQVEFALLSALVQIAAERSLARIFFEFHPSGRNQPTLAFLRSICDVETGQRYVLPLADAAKRIGKAAIAPGAWILKLLVPKPAG